MAGHRLTQRVSALEGPKGEYAGIRRWHWIVPDFDESSEHALARFEAENGPIGPTEGIIRWLNPQ